ncbi:golgin subfamily A member 6-like protein 25 [Mya arenaria]|uniref:golgin subfamily A member 6-like protein 25 n=1 Tax=Mya arenaria TaxID=6604 RepID=UPI0022E920CC|nr:golgin subfamily A member 6-like protein 25 [Mya arenaria]
MDDSDGDTTDYERLPSHILVQKQLQDLVSIQKARVTRLQQNISQQNETIQDNFVSRDQYQSDISSLQESLKSDYVPRDQYDAVVGQLEDEKCEHAATRVRLAEVVEQLESAVAEVTNLQQQLIDQKARYEKQQGTLKSKNMQDTAKAMKLQSKCSEMSQHFEKQEAILTAKDEEIANLERRIKEQGLLYRKEMSEADIEKKQQRYIARLLEEEERKRSRNPSTVTRNNTNTARNPAQMGVPKTKGKKK